MPQSLARLAALALALCVCSSLASCSSARHREVRPGFARRRACGPHATGLGYRADCPPEPNDIHVTRPGYDHVCGQMFSKDCWTKNCETTLEKKVLHSTRIWQWFMKSRELIGPMLDLDGEQDLLWPQTYCNNVRGDVVYYKVRVQDKDEMSKFYCAHYLLNLRSSYVTLLVKNTTLEAPL